MYYTQNSEFFFFAKKSVFVDKKRIDLPILHLQEFGDMILLAFWLVGRLVGFMTGWILHGIFWASCVFINVRRIWK